jgi:hypothetical protein
MKVDVLLAVEQVKDRAVDSCHTVEISNRGWTDINPSNATELGAHAVYLSATAIKSLSSAAKTSAKMKVQNFPFFGH